MADDADLSAIRAWVAAGGQMGVDKDGNPVVPESVVTPDPEPSEPTPATPQQPTPAPQAPKQPAPKQPAKKPAGKPSKSLIGRIGDGLGKWAENTPTPGGNLALVLILVFFAFAVIPVNSGRTRLQLIWDVLTGNAELPGQGSASGPTAQQAAVGQAAASGVAAGLIGTLTGGAVVPSGGGGNPSGIPDPAAQSGSGSSYNPLALLEAPRGDY